MIDQATLVTYLAVLLGFVFIPGPAVLLTLAKASSSGSRAGIATGIGIAVGDLFHTLMAVVGISAIIMASALLFSVIKYAGAAYLVYLGLREIFGKIESSFVAEGEKVKFAVAFKQAVLIEVLNPKSALFFLAFLPQFIKPENGSVSLQVFVLGILFILMGMLSTFVVAICAGNVGTFIRKNPAFFRLQGKIVGTIYCSLGVRLAILDR
jgi:threonine/homoserine/homoserine lactone efflux protein